MLTFAIQMNELSRHIEILLLDNDCVIVPNFGGFMAHHRAAEYMDDIAMFYPPQRTLGFNPQLKLNDSLLAQSYVEAYDISYPEAVRRIENEVEEIMQLLSINGLYEFHGIGTVSMKADGRMEFEPCTAGLLTPSLYALNSFDIELLKVEKPATIKVPVTPVNMVVPKEATLEDVEEELDTTMDEDDGEIHISIQMLRNIVAAAMVLLLFVFTSIPAGRGSSNVSTCSVIDTELISSMVKNYIQAEGIVFQPKQLVVSDSVDNDQVTMEAVADTLKEEKEVQKEEVVAAKEMFAIVLASKVSKAGADEYVTNLKAQGLKEAGVYERGTMRKVIYGNYSTEAEAQDALREMRQKMELFADAWVSKI